MIQRSSAYDLGADKTRMKDANDVERQHATVDALLGRFFSDDPERRWELQLVADEVGMGKTFVALATAYSVLEGMRDGANDRDLQGCYPKVLIITPPNQSLFDKWQREIGEFVKRCVQPQLQDQARTWFSPVPVERFDELPEKVREPGPAVLLASMRLFAGEKLRNYDLKRRLLLAALFRFWGTRLKNDERERLLKGAPDDWPRKPTDVGKLSEKEVALVKFREDEIVDALRTVKSNVVEDLLDRCREIAAPFTHARSELFKDVEKGLVAVYREVCRSMMDRAFPLVIVDEAHNWKNGPSAGTNGYRDFTATIASRARRALLLTATPFQLRPSEMLEILKVSDHLVPTPNDGESRDRRARLVRHREQVIAPVLLNSERASARFSKEWTALPRQLTTAELSEIWTSPQISTARDELTRYAREPGVVSDDVIDRICRRATGHLDPSLRAFFREALQLHAYNEDLSNELGTLVIRHKRRVLHRAFLVGQEYEQGAASVAPRQDRHVLHGAPGIDVRGDAELPQYLLMRCVSEMKGGRTALGTALTGCYTTLLHSNEGRVFDKQLATSTVGQLYLGLLKSMTNSETDASHPKVKAVVEGTVRNWIRGEKTLIFCFRIPTAQRLHDLIGRRVAEELDARMKTCLGGDDALKALKARFTGRDRDLIVLGLDRVLWSFYWGARKLSDLPFSASDLELQRDDFRELARIALEHGVELTEDRVDRVFLNRAVEHVVARRLAPHADSGVWPTLLTAMSDPSWVARPYGLPARNESDEDNQLFDERGVHTVYDRVGQPSAAQVDELTALIMERHDRARSQNQRSIFDVYHAGPSLWLGADPSHADGPLIRRFHGYLAELTRSQSAFDWESRLLAFQALRRAVLRDSILVRLLPERADREESQWDDLLVSRFFAPLPNQSESMADRLTVFLEDLVGASGSITAAGTQRHNTFQATRLKEEFVRLVTGATDNETRSRAFAGFNSPLVPEILICTSVGQEGIDLHRHCRHVIHYDLAWNPAILEQRTGRTDRIGSKTQRERLNDRTSDALFLEIGVPYLAGTYDGRMYEELRLRAQTFEVLTGGDLSAENPEGDNEDEGAPTNVSLVPLPDAMVNHLRVSLHIYSDADRSPNMVTANG